MRKYAIAAAFSLALATPALAAQYYVALDSSTKQCQVVAQKPDGTSMKMVGSGAYKSEAGRREGDPEPHRMQQLN